MKRLFIILAFFIGCVVQSYGYDFVVDGIYYEIISEANSQVSVVNGSNTTEYTIQCYTGNISIPSSVNYNGKTYTVSAIGDKAFAGNTISSISLPNTITTIGEMAFNTTSITEITIPNSVTEIGNWFLGSCKNLTKVVLPSNISEIPYGAFSSCKMLSQIAIPEKVYKINGVAFRDCIALGSIILPSNLTTIDIWAFCGCNNLKSIEIPSGIKSIGNSAFVSCTNLENVYSRITDPSNIGNDAFYLISSSATLHIPKGTKTLYQKYTNWIRDFNSIVDDLDNPNSLVTTYSLSISASGNGYASYGGSTIRSTTKSFTLDEGTSATISFSPDDGNRIASVTVNGSSMGTNSSVTVTMNSNTTVVVVFEEIPVVTYDMTVTAKGNGEASYSGSSVRDGSRTFKVNEGSNPRVTFSPDLGNRTKSVKLNGSEVSFSDNRYIISNVRGDNTLEVEFEELESKFTSDGVNYEVSSFENMSVKIGKGDYGLSIDVPEKVANQDVDYKVEGITDEAMNANKDLAAIIWNPENTISFKNGNPNLLLYVKDAKYAPAGISNIVVGETAESIVLTEAQSGNNFYCPKAFTAKQITYTHRYRMRTGGGESKGWETIALPFDVQKIEHVEEGEIVPFAKWENSSTNKPFWLYQLGTTGFVEADGIKANTPYIISMPNNEAYRDEYILRGTITFSSTNSEIKKSDDVVKTKYGDRTFVPNYINLENNAGYYALNVNNDFEAYQGAEKEGSVFIQNLRQIHPFEAYMTSTAGTRSIGIFDGMTTAIRGVEEKENGQQTLKVYNLNGQCIKTGQSEESLKHELPSGIYIIKGQKIIIK